ncbi:hypothetical protein AGMMS49940_06060 [Spirochaetia bacterium]|nr:hypothetical protein AGMMS49940_06060 [Spirochaetia bacterium]
MKDVEGAAGGGHVFGIDLRSKTVDTVHGIDKVLCRLDGAAAVPAEKKAQDAYPEGGKIMVYIDPPGVERDCCVQGMIHLAHGNAPRQQGRPVLQEEEVAEDRCDASDTRPAQDRIGKNHQQRNGGGMFFEGDNLWLLNLYHFR